MRSVRRATRVALAAAFAMQVLLHAPPPAAAATLLTGFQISTVWSGLSTPTAIAFAPDGRVFVAERAGIVKTFDSVSDPTPTVAADLRTNVHAVGDRGLLGLAVDPGYPARPYVYVSYMLDAPPGGTAPYYNDTCPLNNGHKDGCPATGRVSRLTMTSGGVMTGPEHVLIGGDYWCHQQQGHALDHLEFGPDGALYASSGDGGTASFTDWGQHSGDPTFVAPNACGDPPVPAGTRLSLPTTEGGALRSQDLRTMGDPAGGSGAIVRFDPNTGAALPTNPLIGGDPTDDRHIAYGLRNPYRFTFRPGTSELWIADVGWNTWEELNLVASPTAPPPNFGWPCYEGAPRQPQFDAVNVNLCETLYSAGPSAVTTPYWSYRHDQGPDQARCGNAGSALTALAFAGSSPFPAPYQGALFAGDYVKQCIWILRPGANGRPDPSTIQTLATGVYPVDMETGPGGRLYFVDIGLNRVSVIDYFSANQPPVARVSASATDGPLPLTVQFDASGSTDADGPAPMTYSWDLDGNGSFGDATGVTASRTYTQPTNVTVGLRVSDGLGAIGTAAVTIRPGNRVPVVQISSPSATQLWSAGDTISFSGSASDADDGSLSSVIRWDVILHHCQSATDCHAHPQAEIVGSAGTFLAPEHEYPAHMEFRATVTDGRGATATTSVRIDPRTARLSLGSDPSGITLLAGSTQAATPFDVTVITGSRITVSAPPSVTLPGGVYAFQSWSDGGAISHEFTAGTSNASLTARYEPVSGGWAHVGTGPLVDSVGTSMNVAYPVGVQAGDLLLLGCQGRNNAMTWSATGFSSIARSIAVGGLRLEILSSWASGPASGTLSVTNASGTNGWSCALSAFRGGPGSGDPVALSPLIGSGSTATMTAPAIGGTSAGALVTHWYASSDDNDHGAPSAGETLAFGGTAYHTLTGVDHGSSMSFRVSGGGSVPSTTMQQRANAADPWTAITIVLRPGVGGPANRPPTATNQSLVTDEDTALPVTLSATDPDGDPITFQVTSLPTGGSLYAGASTAPGNLITSAQLPRTLSGPAVTYMPAADRNGTDAFGFSASDGSAAAAGTVSITIRPVDDPPVAVDDMYAVGQGQQLIVGAAAGVLANDRDADGDTLTARLVGDVENGVLSLAADGSLTYTPSPGFTGSDAFTYVAVGASVASNLATVTITVTSGPPPTGGWAHVGTGPLVDSVGTSMNVGYPVGVQAGDLLLLGCQGRNNAMTWSAAGFSSIARSIAVGGLRLEILSSWASGPPSGTLAVTNAKGTNGWSCAITALRGGPGSGSPLDVAPVIVGGSGATMTAPAVSVATAGALVTHWYASSDDNDHGAPSAGETLAFGGTAYHTLTGVDHGSSMSFRVAPTAGSVSSASMTQRANAADPWTAVTLVFRAP